MQDCHTRFPTGCTAAAKYDAYLNLLKDQPINTDSPPTPVSFLALKDFTDRDDAAPADLKKGNHQDFKDALSEQGEGQTFAVVAFLYYAIPSGIESSNCQLPDDDADHTNVDFHIGVGFDSSTADKLRANPKVVQNKKKIPHPLQASSVIVEMTPHTRALRSDVWNMDNLQKAIGHQVRIVGQLLIDTEHFQSSQDCALASTTSEKKTCWRASAWELHPVAQFQVCAKSTNDCDAENPSDWVELDKL